MDNWFTNKEKIIKKTVNAIMAEMSFLIDDGADGCTANYWLDNAHNVFALINDNGDNDKWIEIHYELYDCQEEIVGDLLVLNTDTVSRQECCEQVKVIVKAYYGD